MRMLFWLWAVMLLVCLVVDTTAYWIVRSRLRYGLELALDAALVAGVVEEDLIRGRHLIRNDRAVVQASQVIRKNLEGLLSESLDVQFSIAWEKEMIYAEGKARVEYPFLLGTLAGGKRREIEVSRKLRYQGSYK